MKSTDKLLIGIVVGIFLLVVVAFMITLSRPEASYRAENGPDAIVHNYLLALQKQDHEKAYAYLSPTIEGYPSSTRQFTQDINRYSWSFRLDTDTSLSVEDVVENGILHPLGCSRVIDEVRKASPVLGWLRRPTPCQPRLDSVADEGSDRLRWDLRLPGS